MSTSTQPSSLCHTGIMQHAAHIPYVHTSEMDESLHPAGHTQGNKGRIIEACPNRMIYQVTSDKHETPYIASVVQPLPPQIKFLHSLCP